MNETGLPNKRIQPYLISNSLLTHVIYVKTQEHLKISVLYLLVPTVKR